MTISIQPPDFLRAQYSQASLQVFDDLVSRHCPIFNHSIFKGRAWYLSDLYEVVTFCLPQYHGLKLRLLTEVGRNDGFADKDRFLSPIVNAEHQNDAVSSRAFWVRAIRPEPAASGWVLLKHADY